MSIVSLEHVAKVFTERHIEFEGRDYYYLVANEHAEKAVMIVHGVTGNKMDMAVVGREYIRQGYAVYLPDLPGHGKAPFEDIHTFDDLGHWLHGSIRAIGRTPDILMSHSYASSICYNFALQGYLPAETRMVLGCPTPHIAWSSRLLRWASGFLPGAFASWLYNVPWAISYRVHYLRMTRDKQAHRWMLDSEYHKIPFITARVANSMSSLLDSDNPYAKGSLSQEVQHRTTVVIGENDNVITSKSVPYLRALLPYARFIMVPEVGHILHFEAYEQLAQA